MLNELGVIELMESMVEEGTSDCDGVLVGASVVEAVMVGRSVDETIDETVPTRLLIVESNES